ncbi:Chain length determinant protein [Rubripirellula obstinata]|uniref:Chain length determinant protein n=1 Tax=Rubripirellula obstinata TaxID=406547 RepID=A0A5B1CQB7_9BACT|nr:hypothetical protein [Rubripirellula obstinata]KAA1261414.1 Chain length determinant protein [Rubripirellula obstinata]
MPISYQQWIAAIRQHLHLSIFAFAAVMGLTILVILFAPRSYTSEAKLLLRIGRESVTMDPTASSVGDQLNMHHTRENEIQSAVGVMQSREIVQRVVEKIGEDVVLKGKPKGKKTSAGSRIGAMLSGAIGSVTGVLGNIDPVPASEKAIRQLSEGVYIGSTSESSVVSIAYTTKSPQVAQSVVANWLDSFIDQHAEANHSEGSFEFFADQGSVIRDELENTRLALEQVKNDSNLVSVAGQQNLLEAQLAKVRDSILDVDGEMVALRSRIDSYEDILNSNDSMITSAVTGTRNEARDIMRGQLFELEVIEKNLQSKYKDDHPKLVSIRRQLDDAKKIVGQQEPTRDEVTQSINPAYQQVVENRLLAQAELQAIGKKRETMSRQKDALAKEISELNRTERLVRTLESEVGILEGRYAEHSVKMEQSRLNDILATERITSVNVVQPATLQMRPVSPNKPLCAVAGLLAATALAISLPVLVETRKQQRLANADGDQNKGWGFDQRERFDAGHTNQTNANETTSDPAVPKMHSESVS